MTEKELQQLVSHATSSPKALRETLKALRAAGASNFDAAVRSMKLPKRSNPGRPVARPHDTNTGLLGVVGEMLNDPSMTDKAAADILDWAMLSEYRISGLGKEAWTTANAARYGMSPGTLHNRLKEVERANKKRDPNGYEDAARRSEHFQRNFRKTGRIVTEEESRQEEAALREWGLIDDGTEGDETP